MVVTDRFKSLNLLDDYLNGGVQMRRGRRMRRRTRRRTRRRFHRRRRRRIVGTVLVGGLIAYGAYKLSKRDVQRVEEYTGKPAGELSDEELEQAMDNLNIEKQRVDEDDLAYIDSQESQVESKPSYLDELERLGKLREEGIISQEEFEAKKKQLLGE